MNAQEPQPVSAEGLPKAGITSWAQEILVKASQDGRHQPWKRTFTGQEINELYPRTPDIIAVDTWNSFSNTEQGN